MENKKNIRVISSLRGVCAQLHDSRGASIIIALAMIAAIMFFTIGMASTMIMAIQNTSDSKKALQAEYAAQSGVELANFFLKDKEVGGGMYNDDFSTFDLSDSPNVYVDFPVSGVDRDATSVYPSIQSRSIPIKGFGNAGDCPNSSDDPYADCNWNKLYYGESIEVPFYVGDTTASLTEFDFKVRPPEDGESIASDGNIVLSWQLMGESCTITSCVCVAENGGISGTLIKDSIEGITVNPVLNLSSYCIDSADSTEAPTRYLLEDFAMGDDINLTKPKLKISYVKAVEGSDGDIPYLEYQFLYKGDPLAAMYKVEITGFADGFKFYLNGVQGLGSGLFGFAVQN